MVQYPLHVGNLHCGACLTCLCIKSCLLIDCRRKNFHSVYLKKYFCLSVATRVRRRLRRRAKKNPISVRRLPCKCANRRKKQKSSLQFYQFQTDSRQSPSGYVPACPARARRMAREAAITDPEWQREQPMAERSRIPRPIAMADKHKAPPLLLLSRLLTVHWIKQQSELSSSLHWDVGHWLQPIFSMGKLQRHGIIHDRDISLPQTCTQLKQLILVQMLLTKWIIICLFHILFEYIPCYIP